MLYYGTACIIKQTRSEVSVLDYSTYIITIIKQVRTL